ncbi:MAG: N-acetyltransferase [Rickettsiaceae bacterium]|nr:MAG: N-acetyltransferase [Rickettsiaceae bacterium]
MTQYLNQSFPVMHLDDVCLREIEEIDAENYFNYMNQVEIKEFLTDANVPANLEHSIQELRYWRSLFHNKRSIYWAIADLKSNKLIGTIGFNTISIVHLKGEISYDLDYNFWGQGVMLKCLKNILRFIDKTYQLARIQATVAINNDRSIKLLERCGFQREGTLKKYELVNGVHQDYDMYARITNF